MKDVAALCKRVVIMTQGRIEYDGSLVDIIDSFSGYKVITLQFAEDDAIDNMDRFGEVLEREPPRAKIRVSRADVAKTLAAILNEHAIEDVVVEDPPLEEVIASLYASVDEARAEDRSAENSPVSK
jgi:ABC-2 type transport system ATP-binding protein